MERWVKDAALRRYAVPDKVRNYLLAFDHGNRNQCITEYGLADPFHAEAAALAQGCKASPILWVCVMNMMLAYTRAHNPGPYEYTVDQEGKSIKIG